MGRIFTTSNLVVRYGLLIDQANRKNLIKISNTVAGRNLRAKFIYEPFTYNI